ncbi:MAG TPA: TolC family protein, partial [Dongiaceae bacterium]|nr:TolC family protein [Dongiaceae bacterium]
MEELDTMSTERDGGRSSRQFDRGRVVATLLGACMVIAMTESAHADGEALGFAAAVAAAVRQAPATRIAQLKTREAEAEVDQARGLLLPSLTGAASQINRTFNLRTSGFSFPEIPGSPTVSDEIGPYTVVDARLVVRQPLLDASSWYHVSAARAGVASATANGDAEAEQAAQVAALAYLRAARARAVEDARAADVQIAADLLALAQWRLHAGTSPAIDTTRARTELVSAQGALLLARHFADRARIDVARALGADPTHPPPLADTLSTLLGASDVPADSAAAAAFALAHRPEL